MNEETHLSETQPEQQQASLSTGSNDQQQQEKLDLFSDPCSPYIKAPENIKRLFTRK